MQKAQFRFRFFTRCFIGMLCICFISVGVSKAQNTYYIDGYHGGVWGHYPDWNTRFMVDMLKKHPYWKINLEIEPETWARAAKVDPAAYQEFKSMISGPEYKGRIEYVNPSYAQSYMYTVDGESIIRQLSYGMQMLRQHFPGIAFTTYSSEEPCFTSALPQLLQSFGIRYASLKNPNTCFGGYTAAHGGELVNWQGPDGSQILTVPRYATENLLRESTWQTNAWNNSSDYIKAAFAYGIHSPVGMTLQDAGWKNGPFLGGGDQPQTQNQYVTWRDYFNLVKHDPKPVWKVSQEDIAVSLVWGSQITQRIAQQVRKSENKLLGAEKLLALVNLGKQQTWPQAALDSAWRTLMLSQHHDCWIVPYNGSRGNTWADKVVGWTNHTNHIADSLVTAFVHPQSENQAQDLLITVYNTQLQTRQVLVTVALPDNYLHNALMIIDDKGKNIQAQLVKDSSGRKAVAFNAVMHGFGSRQFRLVPATGKIAGRGAYVQKLSNGNYQVQTDLYSVVIDPKKGGSISSLYAKKLHKEFVDQNNRLKFNAFRGNFYQDGGFKNSADQPADVQIIENGPVRVKLQVSGQINGTNWTELITLTNQQPVIDMDLTLDWKKNTGIGEDTPKGTYDWKSYYKPFYDDRNKLLALFPLNLRGQRVAKNAPFDVTESRLKNTFFSTWDSIKNNVLLNWVDVTDHNQQYGMTLFTDHTTSYAHGEDFPLGLNLQYSGMGLWGRNYTLDGPTHIRYALMPHAGNWTQAKIWSASAQWNEPLVASLNKSSKIMPQSSVITNPSGDLSLTAAKAAGGNFTIRVFNAEGQTGAQFLKANFKFDKAIVETLEGKEQEVLYKKDDAVQLSIPKFGLRTIRFTNVKFK